MRHELKIQEPYADAIADGRKRFEVRINDRGYQAGDTVSFAVIDNHGLPVTHDISGIQYLITYVYSGTGLADGFVVFGIEDESEVAVGVLHDIADLDFSVRTYNILKRNRIDTVEQLIAMTDDDLRALRHMGEESMDEIHAKLKGEL